MEAFRPHACECARQWASASADGELSEFEAGGLARHLVGCAECSRFAARVGWVADALRVAPLARLSGPVTLPAVRRPRHRAVRLPALVAAGLALAAVALAVALPAPRLARLGNPRLPPDNGRAEIDANRLRVAMTNLGPAPMWSGHGPST